jgi:phosphoribosylaminoimidazolecarboxamide formyltransferase/IMP cyclohydrolase
MDELPEELVLKLRLAQKLRYGENPHQSGALYLDENDTRVGVARARLVQGKELSFNNLADADAAFECVAEFDDPAVVIVKHMNPCGAALGESLEEAYGKALACDPVSAFGGIVAVNSTLNEAIASELVKIFLEVIIAPSADKDALAILAAKPNVRVLLTGSMPDPSEKRMTAKSIAGGFLVQSADNNVFSAQGRSALGGDGELKVVTKKKPSPQEVSDMEFAFTICKHVKSNAIVYAKDGATLGIGAGQMSRIISAKIAAIKAEEAKLSLKGSVMASDAFFPFPDCVQAAAEACATAIIQPGGSKNDQASIDAADDLGLAMISTGVRHFRH